jgi:outer membrane cobalamin receptor
MPLEDLMVLADKLGVSVDDLLNMKISVSSKKALNTRESPGIISIVTEEEIRNSGARSLMDILRLVPGMEFGYDMDGAVGIGMRGIWGQEGKVLLLIDGQEMNELMDSTFQLGNHISVASIKRVEILRGPGSCVYGGNAELGVINIITKRSDDINGAYATATGGYMTSDFGRAVVDFGAGKMFKALDFSLTGTAGLANRTDRDYVDPSGNAYGPSTKVAREGLGSLNANINKGDLALRFIYDRYTTRTSDYIDGENAVYNTFDTYLGEAKYDVAARDNLTVTPKVNIKYQVPYQYLDPKAYYNRSALRLTGNTIANWDYSEKLNFVGGAEAYIDNAKDHDGDPEVTFANGKKEVSYYNVSGFAQGLLKLPHTNIVLGGRFDDHSDAGTAFSPRVGVTGPFDKFHYKVIFSKAFRAPGIENINALPPSGEHIKPERTTVFEVELGRKITQNMMLTVNMFDITINDPIIYFYDAETDEEWYQNFAKTGSTGFELEYRLKYTWGNATAAYSYASQQVTSKWGYFNKNTVPDYMVPGRSDMTIGFPQHKLTVNSCFFTGPMSIDPSFSLISSRYAYDAEGIGDLKIGPVFLFNLFVRYPNLFLKGFCAGAGVYNLFNQEYDLIQPYNGGLPPHPGASREVFLKLTYDLGL